LKDSLGVIFKVDLTQNSSEPFYLCLASYRDELKIYKILLHSKEGDNIKVLLLCCVLGYFPMGNLN